MNNRDRDSLLRVDAHKRAANEHRRVSAHRDSSAAGRSPRDAAHEVDRIVATATECIRVRGAERTAQALRAPRTQLLVQLARWSSGMLRAVRVVVLPAAGIGLLLLGMWVVAHARPRGTSNAAASAEGGVPPVEGVSARVWLLRVSPTPDAVLQGIVPFEAHVGYHLYGTQPAVLSVRLVDVPTGQARYFSPPQQVSADHNHAVVSFELDSDRARALFGSGPVQLEAVLRDATPGGVRTVLAHDVFSAWRFQLR